MYLHVVQLRATYTNLTINQSGEPIISRDPEYILDAPGLSSLDRDSRNIDINQQLHHGCSTSRRFA